MQKRSLFTSVVPLFLLPILLLTSCADDGGGGEVIIPDFGFNTTVVFEQNLSAYNIFEGNTQDLIPTADFHLMELSSPLFTDYAHKQRLVRVPEGTQLTNNGNGTINFPDGTILAKTFYYYNDERDLSLGKRVIETRLMIKESGLWNVATYIWNTDQTDATLELNGQDTQVSWVNEAGVNRSTLYHIPTENECNACHQSNNAIIPLGTTLRNLNRSVTRNNTTLNQLTHLQSVGVLNTFDIASINDIVNYFDSTESLTERGRAYLQMNCAHCHNPTAWNEPAEQGFDFRYETPLNQTGIIQDPDEIEQVISNGEMPFIGTTMLDDDGVALLLDFLNNL